MIVALALEAKPRERTRRATAAPDRALGGAGNAESRALRHRPAARAGTSAHCRSGCRAWRSRSRFATGRFLPKPRARRGCRRPPTADRSRQRWRVRSHTAGGLRGCFDLLGTGHVEPGPCAGAEAGMTTGSGVGLTECRSSRVFWATGLFGAGVRFLGGSPLELGLLAEMGVPFHRAAWQIDDLWSGFSAVAGHRPRVARSELLVSLNGFAHSVHKPCRDASSRSTNGRGDPCCRTPTSVRQ